MSCAPDLVECTALVTQRREFLREEALNSGPRYGREDEFAMTPSRAPRRYGGRSIPPRRAAGQSVIVLMWETRDATVVRRRFSDGFDGICWRPLTDPWVDRYPGFPVRFARWKQRSRRRQ